MKDFLLTYGVWGFVSIVCLVGFAVGCCICCPKPTIVREGGWDDWSDDQGEDYRYYPADTEGGAL